jgi:hypothetical protein
MKTSLTATTCALMIRIRVLPLLLLALLAACETATGGPSEESVRVQGEWLAIHPGNDGARTEQRMIFGDDGSYQFEILWYGNYGLPSTELTGYSRSGGSYRVAGERLEVRTEHSAHWQKYAVGTNPSIVVVPNPQWGDHGTVRVVGNSLLHTFTSAPADAPITSTETYVRVR